MNAEKWNNNKNETNRNECNLHRTKSQLKNVRIFNRKRHARLENRYDMHQNKGKLKTTTTAMKPLNIRYEEKCANNAENHHRIQENFQRKQMK